MTMDNPAVLIVEDNLTEQKVLSLLLGRMGYRVIIAGGGHAALEALRLNKDIVLVLMDWQMQDMDGLECTRRIREAQKTDGPQIPIVGVTARAMLGDKQKCIQAGMNAYLSKPFTAVQFEDTITHWALRRTSQRMA